MAAGEDLAAVEAGEEGGEADGVNMEGFDKLIKKIYSYADEFMHKQENPSARKMKAGVLSASFPKDRRDLLAKDKVSKRAEGRLVKYLHDPARFCIYPYFEINIMKYCD